MRSLHTLNIELTREEKNKLDEAADIIVEIKKLLENNKNNGSTEFHLMVYESFCKIYNSCLIIDSLELIPRRKEM